MLMNKFDNKFKVVALTTTLFLLLYPLVSVTKDTLSEANTAAKKGAIEFGFAYGELLYTAFSNQNSTKPASNNIDASLAALSQSYRSKFDIQRAGANLLDKTLDLTITTNSATGGPPAILTGTIVNWGKNKALLALKNKIDEDSKKYLAANLNKFTKNAGLDYDTLHNSNDPEKIKEAIEKNGLILDFKSSFVNDEIGKEALTNSIVRNIIESDKATLGIIAGQKNEIEENKKNIESIGQALSEYATNVNSALNGIDNRVANVKKLSGKTISIKIKDF